MENKLQNFMVIIDILARFILANFFSKINNKTIA